MDYASSMSDTAFGRSSEHRRRETGKANHPLQPTGSVEERLSTANYGSWFARERIRRDAPG